MGWWDTVKSWFSTSEAPPAPPTEPSGSPAEPEPPQASAADLLREMRSSAGKTDASFAAARNRLAVLVMGESDRQRLWQRAHRGEAEGARLLSGIRQPTPRERVLLTELIAELERGR